MMTASDTTLSPQQRRSMWDATGRPVLGHLCAELLHSQQCMDGAAPGLTAEGFLVAGGRLNPVAVNFCPFCGVPLLRGAGD